MKIKDILPLGSVVSLKDSTQKLLIIGVCQQSLENNKKYDYCGCLHPYGYLNSNDIFLFNKEKIDKIYFKGYIDEQTIDFYEDLVWQKSKHEGEKNER